MELTREEAARVAIHFQRLGRRGLEASHATVLDTVQTLGSLQIDTINVVERSQHLVLYSRLNGYRREFLEEALFKQGKLCEYFTNVAAVIPREDYPYYFYGWHTRCSPNNWIQTFWLPKNKEYVERVHKAIPPDRAFSSDIFEASLQRGGHGWSGSELTRALNYLLIAGYLMIHHRKGAQRFYVRSSPPDTSEIDDRKLTQFILRRALGSMGIGTLREIQLARFMPPTDYKREVKYMLDNGTLSVLSAKGRKDDYYMLSERREEIEAALQEPSSNEATLLSPFDSLIINRQRTYKLFGFYPRFEAYIPKEKRKFGYYNMPILYKEKLLGYVDPKLDRKTTVMIFHILNLDNTPDKEILSALVEEFARFLRFHNAERLEVKASQPHNLAIKIQKEVDKELRQS
jgi:uncharacterized protein